MALKSLGHLSRVFFTFDAANFTPIYRPIRVKKFKFRKWRIEPKIVEIPRDFLYKTYRIAHPRDINEQIIQHPNVVNVAFEIYFSKNGKDDRWFAFIFQSIFQSAVFSVKSFIYYII